jgi:hypothetical protein
VPRRPRHLLALGLALALDRHVPAFSAAASPSPASDPVSRGGRR